MFQYKSKFIVTCLNISPKTEPALELRHVWRHITVSTVLTQEEIPEEGG